MRAIVLSFFLVVVIAVSVHAVDQSRIIGTIRPGDRTLDREAALKISKAGQVQVYNYKYPKLGPGSVISCIRILDKWFNGTNGEVYLNSGGVTARSVDLSIRSKIGFGLQYDIEVWGR